MYVGLDSPSRMSFIRHNCKHFLSFGHQVVECLVDSFSHIDTPPALKTARLYLVSDILYNCTAAVRNASKFRMLFYDKLETIFHQLHLTYKAITSRLRAEQFRVSSAELGVSLCSRVEALIYSLLFAAVLTSFSLAFSPYGSRQFQRSCVVCIDVWKDWSVFSPDIFEKLQRIFERGKDTVRSIDGSFS